jgi:hypothetical protein
MTHRITTEVDAECPNCCTDLICPDCDKEELPDGELPEDLNIITSDELTQQLRSLANLAFDAGRLTDKTFLDNLIEYVRTP